MRATLPLLTLLLGLGAASAPPAALAQGTAEGPRYGARLEGFDYPHPVQEFTLRSQGRRCPWPTWTSSPSARTAAPSCCCTARISAAPPGRG
ncbi:hypothetical protein [Teichococcus aestuarii]|uniref:hypothetical protein n=1 Tax=Teichococcus aestuarii TaxID=568898 RepID=UPI00360747E5